MSRRRVGYPHCRSAQSRLAAGVGWSGIERHPVPERRTCVMKRGDCGEHCEAAGATAQKTPLSFEMVVRPVGGKAMPQAAEGLHCVFLLNDDV